MAIYLFLVFFFMIQIPLFAVFENKRMVVSVYNFKMKFTTLLLGIDCFFLILIAAFRANTVGTDTSTYNFWFSKLSQFSFFHINTWSKISRIEIGIGLLAKIGLVIFESYHGAWLILNFVMFCALFMFVGTFSFNCAYSLFLFLCFSLFNQSFNISGQFIAIAMLMLSLIKLKDDNYKGYFFFLLLSFIAHKSAIIGLIFFLMHKIEKNVIKISLFIVLLSFAASRFASFLIPYIVSKTVYSYYLLWEVSTESGIGLLMNLLIWLSFVVLYKDMNRIDKNANIWLFAATLTISLNFFIGYLGMIARVMVYFKVIYIVSIPCLIKAIKNRLKSKQIDQLISFSIAILFATYYLYGLTNSTCFDTIPYIFELF